MSEEKGKIARTLLLSLSPAAFSGLA